jgi:hypothetical protein
MPGTDGVNHRRADDTGCVTANRIGEQPVLPLVDEHSITIEAGADDVWRALLETLDGAFSRVGAASYARLVGCTDATASGPRPLAEGATVPGFGVAAAVPGQELALDGRHRFSAYSLTFRLVRHGPTSTTVRAETRAAFPGVPGRIYRLLVVGTRGHVFAVRRLLAGVRRRSDPTTGKKTGGDGSSEC